MLRSTPRFSLAALASGRHCWRTRGRISRPNGPRCREGYRRGRLLQPASALTPADAIQPFALLDPGEDTAKSSFQYEVALSFAAEDRKYVEAVASSLRAAGVSVFYDRYEEAVLWGKNLYDHLRHVYAEAAEYTVIFSSKAYAQNLWTNHERESAQSRAFGASSEYILPARFDDTEIPGLLKTIGYIDLRLKQPQELASLIRSLRLREPFRPVFPRQNAYTDWQIVSIGQACPGAAECDPIRGC